MCRWMRYPGAAAMLLLSGAAVMAADDGQGRANDDDVFEFWAALSGAQEVVPPEEPATPSLGVETDMAARVRVDFAKDLSGFAFRLLVRNGVGITQAHLHCGRPGENGPVVVFLAPLNAQGANVEGLLAEGTRRNQDMTAGAEACEELIGRPVRNIASLAAAAYEGLIYANVHTLANPAGEVRGQLAPGDVDDDDDGDDDDWGDDWDDDFDDNDDD